MRTENLFKPDRAALLDTIRRSVIGDNAVIEGPWGPRRLVYADYAASGRSLSFIEDFLRAHVMPLYANTHSEASGTGEQTTLLREDARALIHSAVGGGPEDIVLFAGAGATGAVHRLIECMNLRIPADLDAKYGLVERIPPSDRPVVFIGPYEHHSNEIPWRESIAEVEEIQEDERGMIDLAHLERELVRYADRPFKIGSFSAASNVTGILTDTSALAAMLHKHGALAFFDYAAAGPYVKIEMNPKEAGPLAYKDAIFLSPHKFIGGPGSPGVLVAKKALFKNRVPSVPGGGTVAYVNPEEHRFLQDVIHREEGGTPPILESIRAGLAFQLKEAIGPDFIYAREAGFRRRAIEVWSRNPNIHVLGNPDAPALSIISFEVMNPSGQRLHHSFVVRLLNDLFGLQARGGCSCAGPYGHRLLHIDLDTSHKFEAEIVRGIYGIKPGWTRVNFNYFLDDATVDYIVRAVDLVAAHGFRLLPEYHFDSMTGLWKHRASKERLLRLSQVGYQGGELVAPAAPLAGPCPSFEECLAEGERVLLAGSTCELEACDRPSLEPSTQRLRWFALPEDAVTMMKGH